MGQVGLDIEGLQVSLMEEVGPVVGMGQAAPENQVDPT